MLDRAQEEPLSVPAPRAAVPPLRICLLGYRSNPFSGGQGVYIRYLSKALVRAGHSVDVISGEPYPELDPRVRLIKLPGLNLFASPNHVTALRPRHLVSYTDFFEWFSMLTGGFPEPYTFGRRLVRHFRRCRPCYDVIHDNQSLCYGVATLQRMGLPVITTVHHPITSDRDLALAAARNWKQRLLIRRWHSFLRMQRRVIGRLRHLVTVSEQSRVDIARAFGVDESAISVVPNGVDLEIFKPLPGIARTPFQLVTTASADIPLKGLDHLLRALVDVRTQYPGTRLLVVGRLKPDGESNRLLDRLGIRDAVRIVSNIATDELVRHYAESAVAVVPSLYEGFGLPAAEAMATATPIVSTRGGALPEVVGDAGLLVPCGDPRALAGAIVELFANPALRDRLGALGRQRMAERFSWDLAAQRMCELYRGVMLDAAAHR
jgi:glycosyltransferase involved in cell wall biosynthesis